MSRQPCILLVLPIVLSASPFLYAQHGGGGGHGGGHFSSGGFSAHSFGNSVGHSFGHMFGHHSGGHGSRVGKVGGGRGGELPPLAGAAFIHGKVVMLAGPRRQMTQDWHPSRPMSARFIPGSRGRRHFRANQFGADLCASFRFTWRTFLFPDDFDCLGGSFFFDPFFYGGSLNAYFWSDSLADPGDSMDSAGALDTVGSDLPASPEEPGTAGALLLDVRQPVVQLQLLDGSMYGLTRYWVENDHLHYVTDYGGEDSVLLDRVDLAKTNQLNAARGTPFTLPASEPNH